MMTMVAVLVFGSAFSASAYVLAATLGPNWQRIGDALAGRHPTAFAPLSELVQAERRIAVRRWAAETPRRSVEWREAA